jgi:hypothetical protein
MKLKEHFYVNTAICASMDSGDKPTFQEYDPLCRLANN